jgi:hypothetical protein
MNRKGGIARMGTCLLGYEDRCHIYLRKTAEACVNIDIEILLDQRWHLTWSCDISDPKYQLARRSEWPPASVLLQQWLTWKKLWVSKNWDDCCRILEQLRYDVRQQFRLCHWKHSWEIPSQQEPHYLEDFVSSTAIGMNGRTWEFRRRFSRPFPRRHLKLDLLLWAMTIQS